MPSLYVRTGQPDDDDCLYGLTRRCPTHNINGLRKTEKVNHISGRRNLTFLTQIPESLIICNIRQNEKISRLPAPAGIQRDGKKQWDNTVVEN
jgi:hypothetical protein